MRDLTSSPADLPDPAAHVLVLNLEVAAGALMAHLPGCLGWPVWLLDRFDTDWRWGWTDERTPWYPRMRIFRQPVPGDWGTVLVQVRDALARHAVAAAVAQP